MTLSPQDQERMEKAKEKAIKTSFSVHPHDLCAYGVEVGYAAAVKDRDAEKMKDPGVQCPKCELFSSSTGMYCQNCGHQLGEYLDDDSALACLQERNDELVAERDRLREAAAMEPIDFVTILNEHARFKAEVDRLRERIAGIENCLVCGPIANPSEILETVYTMVKALTIPDEPCPTCGLKVDPGDCADPFHSTDTPNAETLKAIADGPEPQTYETADALMRDMLEDTPQPAEPKEKP